MRLAPDGWCLDRQVSRSQRKIIFDRRIGWITKFEGLGANARITIAKPPVKAAKRLPFEPVCRKPIGVPLAYCIAPKSLPPAFIMTA